MTKLRELIDVGLIQSLLSNLNEIDYFPSAIIDSEGNILTATAWQESCTKFHCIHMQSEGECINCDLFIADQLPETITTSIYRCPHGIVDCVTAIIIDGKHLGNFFTGQIFLDNPDIEFLKQRANYYGFDEVTYLQPVENVPIWTQEQLDKHIAINQTLAEILVAVGYKNLKEMEARRTIQEKKDRLKILCDTSPDISLLVDMATGTISDANLAKGYMQKDFRDITERKKLETELLLAKEKAEESDRLKTAFLTNMAHELRTPMNGILGFADLLEDDSLTKEERHEYISIINDSGQSLLNVLTNVIEISKIDSSQINPNHASFNLNELLDELYRWFRKEMKLKDKAHLHVEVIKGLRDDKSVIFTDYAKVRHIFNLLLNNSAKFTHSGFIRFGYSVKEKQLLFFVQDTGKGIAQEKQHIIFDRFRQEEETMSRKYGGVGLGLTIAKSLVEMLGGRIWVESEFGKGATFFFELQYQ